MPNHTGKTPFFDARKLPNPENSYVAWVDVMGVRATMSRSLPITANFVFKLHAAVLDAPQTDIHLYPVMDGVYVVAERQGPLRDFLKAVFSRVADSFVSTSDNHHRFIIKAAIAFGPVIHGDALPRPDASRAAAVCGDGGRRRAAVGEVQQAPQPLSLRASGVRDHPRAEGDR